MHNAVEKWLTENGGSAIQLRVMHVSAGSANDIANDVSALLNIGEVRAVLSYLDGFQTPDRDSKTLEHLIHYHKDACIENFFPFIMDMGFHAGIPLFDEKMAPVMDIFRYLFALSDKFAHCYNYTLMLHRFFFMSGFLFPEAVKSLENRLDNIHKAAKEKILDIYQDESKLPKKPRIWADIGVLKDELNPFSFSAEKPLPTVYDIWALAYYSKISNDTERTNKIDDIIQYILDPKFQAIRESYGLLWVNSRRIYHVCGWGPALPLYEIGNGPAESPPYPMLDYLDFMSNFKSARKSKWFIACLNHFEQFKTERGTYIFPKELLHRRYIDKAFLNETNMSLKRNERELLKRELVSTMKMIEIYKRIT